MTQSLSGNAINHRSDNSIIDVAFIKNDPKARFELLRDTKHKVFHWRNARHKFKAHTNRSQKTASQKIERLED